MRSVISFAVALAGRYPERGDRRFRLPTFRLNPVLSIPLYAFRWYPFPYISRHHP